MIKEVVCHPDARFAEELCRKSGHVFFDVIAWSYVHVASPSMLLLLPVPLRLRSLWYLLDAPGRRFVAMAACVGAPPWYHQYLLRGELPRQVSEATRMVLTSCASETCAGVAKLGHQPPEDSGATPHVNGLLALHAPAQLHGMLCRHAAGVKPYGSTRNFGYRRRGRNSEKLGWLEKPVNVDEMVDLGYLPR